MAATAASVCLPKPELSMCEGYASDVSNAGKFKHNLAINGPDVANVISDTFAGGASGKLTVTLKPGTYEFYCAIPTHKSKGMDMTITVT